MVAKSGVKVLDFGLAKLAGNRSEPDASAATTLTAEHAIVGTLAYMSPEQAAGRAVDHRTDIFSLGIVLYEMIAGRRPFHGDSQPELLNAIIHAPFPLEGVPVGLEDVLARMLAKDTAARYQHAGDLAYDLRRLKSSMEVGRMSSAKPAHAQTRRWRWPVAAAAALALIVLAAAIGIWRLDYFWTNPLAEAAISRVTDFEGDEIDGAISPDGKLVAFLSDRDGPLDAWVTQAGSGNFLNLTKGQFPSLLDQVAFGVGFAGDGAHIWVRGAAKDSKTAGVSLVPVLGGSARRLLDGGSGVFNVAWSSDGARMVYTAGGPDGDKISIAERDGTGARRIFSSQTDRHAHYPVWSPDGSYIYFVFGGVRLMQADVWRVPSAGGAAERITSHNTDVRYSALLDTRRLVYIAPAADGSGDALYGIDVKRRVPHRLSVGVEQYRSVAAIPARPGGRGRLVASVANPTSHVWTTPISASIVSEKDAAQVALPSVRAASPRAGPGYLLYLSSTGGDAGIWKFQNRAGQELWKPSDGSIVSTPSISADGAQLAFAARRNGRGTVFVMSADGTNRRSVCDSIDVQDDPSWSPDGHWLVVAGHDSKANKLFKVRVADGAVVPLIDAVAHYPIWSPDGHFILYRRTDRTKIEAVTPDGSPFPLHLPPIIFRNGVLHPYRVLPDNGRIVVLLGQYRQENFFLFDLRTGEKRQLTDLQPGFSITGFDIAPDGQSIVFDRVRDNADIVMIDLKL